MKFSHPHVNSFNWSYLMRHVRKPDGTTPSLVRVHQLLSGTHPVSEYWLKEFRCVTGLSVETLKLQIRENEQKGIVSNRRVSSINGNGSMSLVRGRNVGKSRSRIKVSVPSH